MQSQAETIEAYLREVPAERREALIRLDHLCRQVLKGYQPSMDYGMPGYRQPGGEIEVAFASQKNYISLYILKKEVLDQHREELSHLSLGKGCIRYRKPKQIDFALVEKLLQESAQSNGAIC
jgi:uncharacterized protein YdhG (YjbR/CyaY superfamily)